MHQILVIPAYTQRIGLRPHKKRKRWPDFISTAASTENLYTPSTFHVISLSTFPSGNSTKRLRADFQNFSTKMIAQRTACSSFDIAKSAGRACMWGNGHLIMTELCYRFLFCLQEKWAGSLQAAYQNFSVKMLALAYRLLRFRYCKIG